MVKKKTEDKYQLIAFWTDEGKRYYQLGRKIDEDKPLADGNVEWKVDKHGKPIKFDDYYQTVISSGKLIHMVNQ